MQRRGGRREIGECGVERREGVTLMRIEAIKSLKQSVVSLRHAQINILGYSILCKCYTM